MERLSIYKTRTNPCWFHNLRRERGYGSGRGKMEFVEEVRIGRSCEVNSVFCDRIGMGILRNEWKEDKKHGV